MLDCWVGSSLAHNYCLNLKGNTLAYSGRAIKSINNGEKMFYNIGTLKRRFFTNLIHFFVS
jgi:hypothetical protein